MNELRWILLVAGVLLIAGLYLWGMRTRWQGRGDADAARKPAVFTGGARGFETAADAADEMLEAPAVLRPEPRSERRIEPNFDADEVAETEEPGLRSAEIEDEAEFERPAIGRREPTFSPHGESVPAAPADELAARHEPGPRPRAATERVEPAWDAAPAATEPEPAKPRRPQKIFSIRVSAQGSARFEGRELLAALRAEGLEFGRYEIFHRLHDDGRPIFSVASLKEPGTFDIEAMPETPYPGVAMFAVLPGPVSGNEAFDEMIFTARAVATHLNGALGDERGAPLTALRVGSLREEALEFERGAGSA